MAIDEDFRSCLRPPKPWEHLPGLRASAPPDGLGGWRASGEGGRPPWGMAAALTLPERRSARRLRGTRTPGGSAQAVGMTGGQARPLRDRPSARPTDGPALLIDA